MTILIVITLVTNLLLQSFIVLMKDADLSANIQAKDTCENCGANRKFQIICLQSKS